MQGQELSRVKKVIEELTYYKMLGHVQPSVYA